MRYTFTYLLLMLSSLFPILVRSQNVSNDELLTILEIKTFRVPSFKGKQWLIDIVPDTLAARKVIGIRSILTSKTSSLIATKFENDSTLSFTLIQSKSTSSQGTLSLKQSRYEITWNDYPEKLYDTVFVIAKIIYEQNDSNMSEKLTHLLIIQLIDELKF